MRTNWAERGPHPVHRGDVVQWCTVDGQSVAATVYSPEQSGSASTAVVFCHGLGSGRDEYAAIGAHVASHGFVSIHPEFEDAFALVRERLGLQHLSSTTWAGDPGAQSEMRELLFDPAQWRSRARRVTAVIDAIPESRYGGQILEGRVVVAGHSYGAFTSQMLSGVHLNEQALDGEDFTHPSVVATALLSPQGSGSRGLHAHSWDQLTVPLLLVTATHDLGANGEGLQWRREPYDAAPADDKWLLIAREKNHALGGIARGGPDTDIAVIAGIAGSITALTAYADGRKDAATWLDDGITNGSFEHECARAAS